MASSTKRCCHSLSSLSSLCLAHSLLASLLTPAHMYCLHAFLLSSHKDLLFVSIALLFFVSLAMSLLTRALFVILSLWHRDNESITLTSIYIHIYIYIYIHIYIYIYDGLQESFLTFCICVCVMHCYGMTDWKFNFVNDSLFNHFSANPLNYLLNVCVCIVTYIHICDGLEE